MAVTEEGGRAFPEPTTDEHTILGVFGNVFSTEGCFGCASACGLGAYVFNIHMSAVLGGCDLHWCPLGLWHLLSCWAQDTRPRM